MAARLQHGNTPFSCLTSTRMPANNAATILKPLMPNPHSSPFTHVADRVAPFPRSQHSPLKSFHAPLLLPPLFLSLTCMRFRGNHHHHLYQQHLSVYTLSTRFFTVWIIQSIYDCSIYYVLNRFLLDFPK